jgi:hypothetical protein
MRELGGGGQLRRAAQRGREGGARCGWDFVEASALGEGCWSEEPAVGREGGRKEGEWEGRQVWEESGAEARS